MNSLKEAFSMQNLLKNLNFFGELNLGLILTAVGIVYFKNPNHFAFGGTSGLSILLADLFPKINVGGFMWIINLVLVVLGFVFLGVKCMGWTIYSSFALSFFVSVCEWLYPSGVSMSGDAMLDLVFAVFLPALGAAIVFDIGASTGGTDFIALWVSNHTGKTIWGVIFGFNCAILAIFGFMFGWDNAAYSIVFQFISTKTIDSFYRRYDRVTLQITTRKADEVMTAYVDHFQHGISCAEVIGGYSREKMYLLHAVVSTYESQDIIKLVCDIDPGAVINVFHTLNFVGGWWGGHVDEPMPTAVPDPDKPARMASRQARLSEQDSLQQDDGK